jgi:hypothetical protein
MKITERDLHYYFILLFGFLRMCSVPMARVGLRRRWEDNIKMDIQEVGWDMDWIDLVQDRNSDGLL